MENQRNNTRDREHRMSQDLDAPVSSFISENTLVMEKIIKMYYTAYEIKHWKLMEYLLADGFTFTSPNNDDHIDINTFKEKCWPAACKTIKRFDLEKVISKGEEAFARYQCTTTDGAIIRNTEYFKFENGHIKAIEVFFGTGQELSGVSATTDSTVSL